MVTLHPRRGGSVGGSLAGLASFLMPERRLDRAVDDVDDDAVGDSSRGESLESMERPMTLSWS